MMSIVPMGRANHAGRKIGIPQGARFVRNPHIFRCGDGQLVQDTLDNHRCTLQFGNHQVGDEEERNAVLCQRDQRLAGVRKFRIATTADHGRIHINALEVFTHGQSPKRRNQLPDPWRFVCIGGDQGLNLTQHLLSGKTGDLTA